MNILTLSRKDDPAPEGGEKVAFTTGKTIFVSASSNDIESAELKLLKKETDVKPRSPRPKISKLQ